MGGEGRLLIGYFSTIVEFYIHNVGRAASIVLTAMPIIPLISFEIEETLFGNY